MRALIPVRVYKTTQNQTALQRGLYLELAILTHNKDLSPNFDSILGEDVPYCSTTMEHPDLPGMGACAYLGKSRDQARRKTCPHTTLPRIVIVLLSIVSLSVTF